MYNMDVTATSSTNTSHYAMVASPPAPSTSAALHSMVASTGPAAAIMTPANIINNINNNNNNGTHMIDEIATENYWLREKMKEISADRDRLLCEVANLRLELDMAELKRLPEDR